jgi:hypothetical protein
MQERIDIRFRQAEGSNPPGLLERIEKDLKDGILMEPDSKDELKKAASKDRVGRGAAIMGRVLAIIAQKEDSDRQGLIEERQLAEEAIKNSKGTLRAVREEALEAAKEKQLELIKKILGRLSDLNVDVVLELQEVVVKWQATK